MSLRVNKMLYAHNILHAFIPRLGEVRMIHVYLFLLSYESVQRWTLSTCYL